MYLIIDYNNNNESVRGHEFEEKLDEMEEFEGRRSGK